LRRRVVVTGVGLVIPTGIGVAEAWKNVCEGKSGIGALTRFDAKDFETRIAGQVKGFTPEEYIEKKDIKKMDLFVQYALAATKESMEDAQLKITPENSEQVGVIVGTGLGGLPTLEETHKVLLAKWGQGTQYVCGDSLRHRSPLYRGCVPGHSVRRRGSDHRRGNRGKYHAPHDRRVQCHEGPFNAK
jgi:hypothetical protein